MNKRIWLIGCNKWTHKDLLGASHSPSICSFPSLKAPGQPFHFPCFFLSFQSMSQPTFLWPCLQLSILLFPWQTLPRKGLAQLLWEDTANLWAACCLNISCGCFCVPLTTQHFKKVSRELDTLKWIQWLLKTNILQSFFFFWPESHYEQIDPLLFSIFIFLLL